jgi:hypothetical protein
LNKLKDELKRKTSEFRQNESRLIYELEENKKLIDSLNLKLEEKDNVSFLNIKMLKNSIFIF